MDTLKFVRNATSSTNQLKVSPNEKVDKLQIKPSQIDLSSEIIKIGTYYAKINLHAEIIATIHIEVVKE